MTKEEIITKVRALDLPKDSYVVFGSCPLAIVGLREANDIDLLVSKEIFTQLKKSGWKELYKSENDKPLSMVYLKRMITGILVRIAQHLSICFQPL